MSWVKGKSGNPKGRPQGIYGSKTLEIQEVARRVLLGDNPQAYFDNVWDRIKKGQAPHMEKFFAEHLWGKPRDPDSKGNTTINIQVINYGDTHDQRAQPIVPEARTEYHGDDPGALPATLVSTAIPPGDADEDQTRVTGLAPKIW
jgi:Family of unknown function (DUF5681)